MLRLIILPGRIAAATAKQMCTMMCAVSADESVAENDALRIPIHAII